MRIGAESVANLDMNRRKFRLEKAVAVFALVLVSACSSKNPDSLIGMNLDENAAMMDANAASEATIASDSNEGAAANSASASQAAANAPATQSANHPGTTADDNNARKERASASQEPSAEPTDVGQPEDQSDASPNQVGNEEDPPGAG